MGDEPSLYVCGRLSRPFQQAGVDPHNSALGARNQKSAKRRVEKIVEVLAKVPVVKQRHRKNASIAAMVSFGALRLGQCPVACRITSLLPGIWRCTYSPTHWGAITSCEHCRIKVGTRTL